MFRKGKMDMGFLKIKSGCLKINKEKINNIFTGLAIFSGSLIIVLIPGVIISFKESGGI